MSTVPNKVIYSMIGVSKYYDKKAVLKDIYLSYFYGAKIGVIGLNGSGKSTLLKILAGVDQDFQGKTAVSPGFTIGFLEQEPQEHSYTHYTLILKISNGDLPTVIMRYILGTIFPAY